MEQVKECLKELHSLYEWVDTTEDNSETIKQQLLSLVEILIQERQSVLASLKEKTSNA